MTEIFAALGEPTRHQIVERLALRGPQTLGKLVHGLSVTRQAATRHLHVLRDAGIVRIQKSGREQRCELELAKVQQAHAWLQSLEKDWDLRMKSLQKFLDGEE